MDISRSFQNPTPQLKFKALLQKFLNCRHTATVFDFLGHRHWYHKVWKSFLPNFHISILFALCRIPSKRPSMLGMHTPANALDLTGATVLAGQARAAHGFPPCMALRLPNSHDGFDEKKHCPTISVDFANAHKSCECLCPIGFSVPQKVVKKKLLLHWHCHHPETARLAKVVPQLRSAGVETPLHWNTKNMHPAQRHRLVQYGF